MKHIFTIAFLILLSFSPCNATVYFSDDFESYTDETTWQADSTWSKESLTTLQTSGCYGGTGKCARMTYLDDWHQLAYSLGNGYPEGYLGFRAKLTNKQAAWVKFLKFFGTDVAGGNYANWTSGTSSYTNVSFSWISYSDDEGTTGDSECRVRWTDCSDTCSGTVDVCGAEAFTFPDESWHQFVYYWKLSTNGESAVNADGAFSIWIDGVQVLGATGLVNRAFDNTRGFALFALGDYTSTVTETAWYLWFDNVILASSYNEAAAGGSGRHIMNGVRITGGVNLR